MAVRMGDFTNVLGGFPIEVNGEVIGGGGNGGAKIEQDQDVEVAKAALKENEIPIHLIILLSLSNPLSKGLL